MEYMNRNLHQFQFHKGAIKTLFMLRRGVDPVVSIP